MSEWSEFTLPLIYVEGADAGVMRVLTNLNEGLACTAPSAGPPTEHPLEAARRMIAAFDERDHYLGAAFVVAQEMVNEVTTRVMQVAKAVTDAGLRFDGPDRPRDIRRFGVADEIELIWHSANYYKHHEEWSFDWSDPPRRSRETLEVITRAGMQQDNAVEENLRIVLNKISGPGTPLQSLYPMWVKPWRRGLAARLMEELRTKQLVTAFP